ncbi:MAG: glutathione S-transferase family protein [Pseudomonadota bacterium]|nr:glutathione S-transferase family protein [Pseudomonadota bacterium]
MPTLVHYPLCPYSRSIRLALAECGVDAVLEEQRPWSWDEDLLKVNPAASMPMWREDKGPTVCGAYAISEYLSEKGIGAGGDPRAFAFFPGDAGERAEVRRVTEWFHRKFDAEVSAYLLGEKLHRRFDASRGGSPDMDMVRAGQANLRYHLTYIRHLVSQRNWLAGEHLSFADLSAAAHLSCIDYLGDVPWDTAGPARDWYARIKSRPSFRTLLGDAVPGMSPPPAYADPDF